MEKSKAQQTLKDAFLVIAEIDILLWHKIENAVQSGASIVWDYPE